jgi:hypothetical protein
MTEDMPAMINLFVRRRGVTREILADLVKHTIHADATATAALAVSRPRPA